MHLKTFKNEVTTSLKNVKNKLYNRKTSAQFENQASDVCKAQYNAWKAAF